LMCTFDHILLASSRSGSIEFKIVYLLTNFLRLMSYNRAATASSTQ